MAAVLDGSGKLVMEAIVETKAVTIVEFIDWEMLPHGTGVR